jgi:hypothetical protein
LALADLHAVWTIEADTRAYLVRAMSERDRLREFVTVKADYDTALAPLDAAWRQAQQAAVRAREQAESFGHLVDTDATRYAGQLTGRWDELRPTVRETARTVLDGPGRFGLHRRAVQQAEVELQQWVETWRPVIPDLPAEPTLLARVAAGYDGSWVHDAIPTYARAAAQHAHPEHRAAVQTAQAVAEQARQAETTYRQTADAYDRQLIRYGSFAVTRDPQALLASTEQHVAALTDHHNAARAQIKTLLGEPALRSLPNERLKTERDAWQHDRDSQRQAEQPAGARAALTKSSTAHRHHPGHYASIQPPDHGKRISTKRRDLHDPIRPLAPGIPAGALLT